MKIPTYEITGYPICSLRLSETVELLHQWIDDQRATRPRFIVCGNPSSLEVARGDPPFRAAIMGADLVSADGIGVFLASRILGGTLHERVCGPDIFQSLSRRLDQLRPGTRIFFLGTNEKTLAALVIRFQREYPQLVVAGTFAPPYKKQFTPEDDRAMVQVVNDAKADVLWVSLGAPKQEKWCFRNRDALNVKLVGPIGAVFDFYTGGVKLPPRWAQRIGLIWIYRLMQEPRRQWFRNLLKIRFIARVFGARIARPFKRKA